MRNLLSKIICKIHNDDFPAIEDEYNTTKIWYKNGLKHRNNDLPAFDSDHLQEWWKDGKLHRDNDLPAVVS